MKKNKNFQLPIIKTGSSGRSILVQMKECQLCHRKEGSTLLLSQAGQQQQRVGGLPLLESSENKEAKSLGDWLCYLAVFPAIWLCRVFGRASNKPGQQPGVCGVMSCQPGLWWLLPLFMCHARLCLCACCLWGSPAGDFCWFLHRSRCLLPFSQLKLILLQ